MTSHGADRIEAGDIFRPNVNARLAGTTDIVPHPDGSINDYENPELIAYLQSLGMNDARCDTVSTLSQNLLANEITR